MAAARQAPGRYESMVIESYRIHWGYNFAAALSVWILLAGFIVLPGTFRSLDKLRLGAQAGSVLHDFNRQTPLFCLSGVCCLAGMLGIFWLWLKFRHNYVWLSSHLFGPGLSNSVSGLLTVLVGVYASQDGDWSVAAKATLTIVILALSYMLVSLATYQFWFRKM